MHDPCSQRCSSVDTATVLWVFTGQACGLHECMPRRNILIVGGFDQLWAHSTQGMPRFVVREGKLPDPAVMIACSLQSPGRYIDSVTDSHPDIKQSISNHSDCACSCLSDERHQRETSTRSQQTCMRRQLAWRIMHQVGLLTLAYPGSAFGPFGCDTRCNR